MSYNLRLHGGSILRSRTPLFWEEDITRRAMMKRVTREMSITQELWVCGGFDPKFKDNEVEFFSDGSGCQYNGFEIFLLFLARKGYEGEIKVVYDFGDDFSKKSFRLEEGKLLCVHDNSNELPTGEITLDILLPNFLLFS